MQSMDRIGLSDLGTVNVMQLQSPTKSAAVSDEKLRGKYPSSLLELRQQQCFQLRDFELGTKPLGSGRFGTVYKARERLSRRVVCLKQVNKRALEDEGVVRQFQREVETHVRLDHAHILKMFAYFHDACYCYIVLEYANGGTLFDRLGQMPHRKAPEKMAACYIRQLCSALAYLHKRGVLHRDIKPENVLLFVEQNGSETLKLGDFGWTVAQRKNAQRTTLCGTAEYLPPEVCTPTPQAYDQSFDMYTVGILLYEMLCGVSPFAPSPDGHDASLDATKARILRGSYKMPAFVTMTARALIQSLLSMEPSQRPSAVDVLNHPWVVRHAGATDETEWNR